MKLIEATHILCRTQILHCDLQKANELLLRVAEEFEILYGPETMTFNVHLLRHTADCVKKNGPLFAYSNYCTEDNIGHLISFVKGPTDALFQISERYLLEKNLIEHLENSPYAKSFSDQIQCTHFQNVKQFANFLLVGKSQTLVQNTTNSYIFDELQMNAGEPIESYRAVFVDSNIYFETATPETEKKQTFDSFVCIHSLEIYGIIEDIFLYNNDIFFAIRNKYRVKADALNLGIVMTVLEENPEPDWRLIKASLVKSKYALIITDTITTCSEFPNLFERN